MLEFSVDSSLIFVSICLLQLTISVYSSVVSVGKSSVLFDILLCFYVNCEYEEIVQKYCLIFMEL